MNSLLVAPQWIGDAVMAQPLVAALAARGETVTVLALPAVAAVARAMPGVTDVIEARLRHKRLDWSERRRLGRELGRRGFGRAYILGNNVKARLIPWLARIPERVGWRGEAAGLLLTQALQAEVGEQRGDLRAHYAALAGVADATEPELRVEPAQTAAALRAFELDSGYIALCPGAEYGPAKQWPGYAELAALAHAQGWPVVVLGGAKDEAAGAVIAAAGARNLCGRTSMPQALALLAGAAGVVSNDSGLMHLAAALKRPTLGIYGSTDPRHTPPAAHRSAVLWRQLDCSPCFQRVCPLGHLNCLRGIEASEVWQRLQQLLA